MPNETVQAAPALAADGHELATRHIGGNFWVLALGSVGVVFGDIGTSPLYALQTALGQFKDKGLGPTEVVGIVSLIIWALLIVVTAKYVLFLMQADNKGEGGILSLMALAQTALRQAHNRRVPARRRRARRCSRATRSSRRRSRCFRRWKASSKSTQNSRPSSCRRQSRSSFCCFSRRAAARRASPRSSGRSWSCSSSSTPCSASCASPRPGASCAR